MKSVTELIAKVNEFIVNPAIRFLFVVATAVFFFGVFEFLMNTDDSQGKENGKRHMVWGVIGMFIMITTFGIMNLIAKTIGADPPV